MKDKKQKSVRFEEETISIVDHNLAGRDEEFSSISYFIEYSVRSQSSQILQIVVDGDTLRKLIRHLNKIEGINESKPTCETDARWGNEQFDSPIEFSAKEETLGEVNQIKLNTGISQSVIFRSCVFKQLNNIASRDPHPFDYDWKAKQIRLRWRKIANSFVAPQTEFYESLLRIFDITGQWTIDTLRNDKEKFKHFAEIYYEEFYGTETYDQIVARCGESVFSTVENTIEELTEYDFQKDLDGWLTDEIVD